MIILNTSIFLSMKAQQLQLEVEEPLYHQDLCEKIIQFQEHPSTYFLITLAKINEFQNIFSPSRKNQLATGYQINEEMRILVELSDLFYGYSYIIFKIDKKNNRKSNDIESSLGSVRRLLSSHSFTDLDHRVENFNNTLNKAHEYIEKAFFQGILNEVIPRSQW